MSHYKNKVKYYYFSFQKHDLKASIAVFFVALPLCLGIALASGTPIYSGLISGIIGGTLVAIISKSQLSVSGPAAGLTAICAASITELGSLQIFFLAIVVAGILQIVIGLFKLGGFTHFIPSTVIKGMLAAIGIILITKQIPLVIGYGKPDFWTKEFFNIITLNNVFSHLDSVYQHTNLGVILIVIVSLIILYLWKILMRDRNFFIPPSIFIVSNGIFMAWLFKNYFPDLQLLTNQFITIPNNIFSEVTFPDFSALFIHSLIWKNAVIICFVATLETLLSTEAIDKLDPFNRITPRNHELIAQGIGNISSGILGGLPITAVIVRSSANAEAKAKTKLSAIMHGIWLLIAVVLFVPVLNMIPYCVLAIILIRTGYNLAKPKMIKAVYKQGREQFLPFIVTVISILFTDLLIGVLIGIGYAIYFLIKHNYKEGISTQIKNIGHAKQYSIDLATNVSFLNKKSLLKQLDEIPEYSVVEINGAHSLYIDRDILEIIQDYKVKAKQKHIQLKLIDIAEVETIGLH